MLREQANRGDIEKYLDGGQDSGLIREDKAGGKKHSFVREWSDLKKSRV